ncbi:hypothetical protein [Aeromicrobium sp. HA]|uniref:hypothetical protein n=1 Tax=unclassified Aeromicrobium TaxID=2633570 RepID=UPI0022AFF04A|nr:hypothetical protein [Aeromicrobium sp. HA]
MAIAPEVTAAARRILDGDDSAVAAAALEEALHAYHPHKEKFEDFLETLSLYAPSMERPYTDHRQLCVAIRQSAIVVTTELWCADGGMSTVLALVRSRSLASVRERRGEQAIACPPGSNGVTTTLDNTN